MIQNCPPLLEASLTKLVLSGAASMVIGVWNCLVILIEKRMARDQEKEREEECGLLGKMENQGVKEGMV